MKASSVMQLYSKKQFFLFLVSLFVLLTAGAESAYAQGGRPAVIRGTVKDPSGKPLDYVNVYLKGTSVGAYSDASGKFVFRVPPGKHVLCAQLLGYASFEQPVDIRRDETKNIHIKLDADDYQLDEVVIMANGVTRVKQSAYNAIAVDAKALHNSTLDLAGSLIKVPGIKLRESGGVGSDMNFMMDGFSGRHIKVFIDGVPQEGVGNSFGMNNIPVNFAERIEVYKGVVPVGFGADAIGGVVNIVTSQQRKTYIDASYSYGSFNTHKSYINVGHTTTGGFSFEVGAFQNYSDNSYKVYTPVENLQNGQIDKDKYEWVKRFHDTYHNETVMAKAGLVGKRFADRLMFGIKYSQNHKEIQNGVRQEIVFGEKESKGHSVMPSLEYLKSNLFTKGLNIRLTANYNNNVSYNVDTTAYQYNWYGGSILGTTVGEQRYQDSKFKNDNWNGTFNASYRIDDKHSFILNHALTAFKRKTESVVEAGSTNSDAFAKKSQKNITGLSYRFNYKELWNISAFGKYYNQYGSGPVATSSDGYAYELYSGTVDDFGYGAAGTIFLKDFQVKLSYEKALRLPTVDEMFGDEDLERGSADLKPERSDNFNISLSYSKSFRKHFLFVEAGGIYRNTKDYIKRSVDKYSGGLYYGSYLNFGKVETMGLNTELRYNYSKYLSVGGSFTMQSIRDNEKMIYMGIDRENPGYGARMPNIPYFFSNADASFYVHNLFRKGNLLTITYDNLYVRNYCLYPERDGSSSSKIMIPSQFSHNLGLVYSMKNGRYNLSFECRNFTNERVYDNYSLQKAGRAFYGKFRYFFSK